MMRLRRTVDWLPRVLGWLPRPLDPVRSIKAKLSLALGLAGGVGLLIFWGSFDFMRIKLGWFGIAVALGLVTLQVMAHGATVPLREMTDAAKAMARGDYTRRVRATSRDEVGELATAFNQMAADLAAADRQRRELIANVSHELRTPITALRGLLENIVDGVCEAEPETMRTALTQTERLGRLVTELLDLSRLDAGVVPMTRASIDIRTFLAAVVREATVNADGAGHDVHFTLSAPAIRIEGDRERLHQVFANLLDNAARHSPPGGTVTVRAERRDANLLVVVADEGEGIPPADRDKVFERFTRGERATDGGTGLGLAIARWVVQLHHGTIAVVDPATTPPGPATEILATTLDTAPVPALSGAPNPDFAAATTDLTAATTNLAAATTDLVSVATADVRAAVTTVPGSRTDALTGSGTGALTGSRTGALTQSRDRPGCHIHVTLPLQPTRRPPS